MKLKDIVRDIQLLDTALLNAARARQDRLTKPPGSLGRLEALGVRLAGVYGELKPRVRGKAVVVFAGDHGVTAAGVSAYPQAVTEQMVLNFLRGGAAVNALAGAAGAELLVVDVGVDAEFGGDTLGHPQFLSAKVARGTRNMLLGPALTSAQVESALAVGAQAANRVIDAGANLVVGGDMGIGNTTSAAALTAALTGRSAAKVTGRGTGLDDAGLRRKIEVVGAALERHDAKNLPPLELLSAVGGLEIAALTGFYLAAAARRAAAIVDGFIVSAAALVAAALEPKVKAYLFASHTSQEPGHLIQLAALGLAPLFDFDMRLGEGTGGVLALSTLEGAAAVLAQMATFEEAGVSEA